VTRRKARSRGSGGSGRGGFELALLEPDIELARLPQRHTVGELLGEHAGRDNALRRIARGRREGDPAAGHERRGEMRSSARHLAARRDEVVDGRARAIAVHRLLVGAAFDDHGRVDDADIRPFRGVGRRLRRSAASHQAKLGNEDDTGERGVLFHGRPLYHNGRQGGRGI